MNEEVVFRLDSWQWVCILHKMCQEKEDKHAAPQSWLVTLPREASSKPVLVRPEVPWVLEVAGREASSDSGLVTSKGAEEEAASVVSSVSLSPQPTGSCSFSALPSSSSSPLSPSMASSPRWHSTPSKTSVGTEWDTGKEIRAVRETKEES